MKADGIATAHKAQQDKSNIKDFPIDRSSFDPFVPSLEQFPSLSRADEQERWLECVRVLQYVKIAQERGVGAIAMQV